MKKYIFLLLIFLLHSCEKESISTFKPEMICNAVGSSRNTIMNMFNYSDIYNLSDNTLEFNIYLGKYDMLIRYSVNADTIVSVHSSFIDNPNIKDIYITLTKKMYNYTQNGIFISKSTTHSIQEQLDFLSSNILIDGYPYYCKAIFRRNNHTYHVVLAEDLFTSRGVIWEVYIESC